ncbi:MAG: undecaprenyldiphospho-muramoylpentapeptide beta-N-acetylglucosaminyltransferase [Gammaproteobacteria bacterium]|nr:undecaprenyldiphospho-muramoylpentapeptide beta-N-acetylglucosaminyltransferase [Gammaproteobacteria bacterium]
MAGERPVMITAGGTGGHVYPGLAVARELEARGIPVLWMGTRKGLEARVIPAAGIPMAWCAVSALRGKGVLTWLLAPFRLAYALAQAGLIVLRHRPRLVLGMGGFVSGPGGAMAALFGRPLVIHEQNAVAGLTNRILARLALRVLLGFPDSFAASRKTVYTGNPVRADIAAIEHPELRLAGRADQRLRVLVVGGSLGAQALNQALPEALARMDEPARPQVWHQTGPRNLEETRARYRQAGVEGRVDAYIEDMAEAYAWADVVVCRAGALTVAELAAVGVGAILVPFPFAVDDHQSANAHFLAHTGAAVLLPQASLTPERLADELAALAVDRERVMGMAMAARAQARPEAVRHVADLCEAVMRGEAA